MNFRILEYFTPKWNHRILIKFCNPLIKYCRIFRSIFKVWKLNCEAICKTAIRQMRKFSYLTKIISTYKYWSEKVDESIKGRKSSKVNPHKYPRILPKISLFLVQRLLEAGIIRGIRIFLEVLIFFQPQSSFSNSITISLFNSSLSSTVVQNG